MKHSSAATLTNRETIPAVASAVVCTLLYHDIFSHPLTRDEIHLKLQGEKTSASETDEALAWLLMRKLIETDKGFFFLPGKSGEVDIRKTRNKRCEDMMPKAMKNARLISRFPFVRGVAFSGSISKGTVDIDGDVDFFIITEPGRLWVCRSFLVLYKKLFRFNSKKYFCVNYFIDTKQMHIPDHNLFVATEVSSLKPVHGNVFACFYEQNSWIRNFYPNHEIALDSIPDTQSSFIKRFSEKIFGGRLGEWLDERFFRITLRRWEKKFPHVKREQFDLNFRSRKNVSKHHPQGFQWKVKKELDTRIEAFCNKNDLHIHVPVWEIENK